MITFTLLFFLLVGLFITFVEKTKIGDRFMCWLFKVLLDEDVSNWEE